MSYSNTPDVGDVSLIDPDLDLDNDGSQSYTLDLIEWDSDATTTSMGALGVSGAASAFDPEPSRVIPKTRKC